MVNSEIKDSDSPHSEFPLMWSMSFRTIINSYFFLFEIETQDESSDDADEVVETLRRYSCTPIKIPENRSKGAAIFFMSFFKSKYYVFARRSQPHVIG
jgi:hypothetical protein